MTTPITCNIPAPIYRIVSISSNILELEFTNPLDMIGGDCPVEIQISFNTLVGGSRIDWKFLAFVTSHIQLVGIALPPTYGTISVRYYNCCNAFPSPSPIPGPCAIVPCDSDVPCPSDPPSCLDVLLSFTDVYKEPLDILNTTPINPIWVPREFKITVSQTNCDATARIESNPCRIPDRGTNCGGRFQPVIDILTLPILANSACYSCSRPIDIDSPCRPILYVPAPPIAGERRNVVTPPRYYAPDYTIFKLLWFKQSQPPIAHPSIDCHVYDVNNVPALTWILVHTTSTDSEMRQWVCEHFRFHCMVDGIPRGGWPYNDLYWTAWDEVSPTLEQNTVYINLIPC